MRMSAGEELGKPGSMMHVRHDMLKEMHQRPCQLGQAWI